MSQLILADKSDLFRRSISSVLSREGYEVVTAETGHRVLSLVQTIKPAAIILDLETPDPSGLETLLLLKRDPATRRVPVVLVSRDSTPSAVSNAFKVGAEGFMLKPIDLNQLLKTLNGLQIPIPAANAAMEVAFEGLGNRAKGTLRFIDQYGQIYVDKAPEDAAAAGVWDPNAEDGAARPGIAPLGSAGILKFEVGKHTYHQGVMLVEENEHGFALYPAGDPSLHSPPELLKVPVNFKGRYLVPGSFMRLAEVVVVHSKGIVLAGLSEEPRFNSPIQMTVYPPSSGPDGGITLKGKIASTRPGSTGHFEVEVDLVEAPGSSYVHLLAEVISGRPYRSE